ncbi:MAG: hypothetical protein NTW19_13810 [Planctomycetota bacterium]|nr:hypothetical protein [Planctomycetota bacterium]
MISRLPARHVHLDFHTSEHVPGVGKHFSPAQFKKALKLGGVNHITLFAKCHHSWSYYPTKAGMVHPTLKIDLLGQQLDACHSMGVRAPIYYTIGWSATDAARNPQWKALRKDGSVANFSVDPKAKPEDKRPGFSWEFLCINGPYRDLILAQTQEICAGYRVDGFFYDICILNACWCSVCKADMKTAGVDADDEAAAGLWYTGRWRVLMEDCRRIIFASHPEASVFFNGRAEANTPPELLEMQTHYELEDLPTTWGGYDKFPLRARAFVSSGKPILAMSGKFHTAWGEFGGFKHPDAIRFEAAAMIAYGAACSFGDQMHPGGEMDLATYKNIGEAYRYVEKIEDYGLDAQPYATLGLLLCKDHPHDQGAANMLLESQIDFEVVDPESSDWSRFETILLPGGGGALGAATLQKLQAYVKKGGSLLVQNAATLDAAAGRFLLDLPVQYVGPARFDIDYTLLPGALGKELVASPFLNYAPALRVKPAKGAKVLAKIHEPYFSRTYGKYCSHQNTPNQIEPADHPAAVQAGRVIYLAHPIGHMYFHNGARLHRDLFIAMLRKLHRKPALETSLLSAGRATLVHQPQYRRYVAHLLYGAPIKRGRCEVIEDLPELFDVPVAVRLPEKVRKASLPLSKKKLATKTSGGAVRVTVPRVKCHEMVVFEY